MILDTATDELFKLYREAKVWRLRHAAHPRGHAFIAAQAEENAYVKAINVVTGRGYFEWRDDPRAQVDFDG